MGQVLDLGLDVEHLGDALCARHRLGDVGRELGQAADRLVHVRQVADHEDQLARQHPPVQDLQRAEQHRRRRSDRRDDLRRSRCGGFEACHADALPHRLGGHGVEPLLFVSLAGECLHQGDGREHLGHAGVDLALLLLLCLGRGLGLSIQVKQAEAEERQRGQRDRGDLPVQHEHDGQHADHGQGVGRELHDRVREEVLERVGVAGNPGHQVARARAIVKGKREPLEVREQFPAERVDHPVADRRGDEDLRVGKEPRAERDQHNGGGGPGEERRTVGGGDDVEKPQGPRQRPAQDDVVQDDLQRPGLEELHRGDAHCAGPGKEQAPPNVAQVLREHLPESPCLPRPHGDPPGACPPMRRPTPPEEA